MLLNYEFISTKDQLRDKDVAGVNGLLKQLTRHPRELTRQDLEAIVHSCHLLLVRDLDADGRVVGMTSLVRFTTPSAEHGRVEDVVVDEEYRQNGIARRMLEILLSTAKELGVQKVELTSNPSRVSANELYRRAGFEQVETNVYRLRLGP